MIVPASSIWPSESDNEKSIFNKAEDDFHHLRLNVQDGRQNQLSKLTNGFRYYVAETTCGETVRDALQPPPPLLSQHDVIFHIISHTGQPFPYSCFIKDVTDTLSIKEVVKHTVTRWLHKLNKLFRRWSKIVSRELKATMIIYLFSKANSETSSPFGKCGVPYIILLSTTISYNSHIFFSCFFLPHSRLILYLP